MPLLYLKFFYEVRLEMEIDIVVSDGVIAVVIRHMILEG